MQPRRIAGTARRRLETKFMNSPLSAAADIARIPDANWKRATPSAARMGRTLHSRRSDRKTFRQRLRTVDCGAAGPDHPPPRDAAATWPAGRDLTNLPTFDTDPDRRLPADPGGRRARREPELDGLRAMAALMVALLHCLFAVGMPSELRERLVTGPAGVAANGNSAVILFFV